MEVGNNPESNPITNEPLPEVTFGNLKISPFSEGVLWMFDEAKGDGQSVPETELIAALQKFYDERF